MSSRLPRSAHPADPRLVTWHERGMGAWPRLRTAHERTCFRVSAGRRGHSPRATLGGKAERSFCLVSTPAYLNVVWVSSPSVGFGSVGARAIWVLEQSVVALSTDKPSASRAQPGAVQSNGSSPKRSLSRGGLSGKCDRRAELPLRPAVLSHLLFLGCCQRRLPLLGTSGIHRLDDLRVLSGGGARLAKRLIAAADSLGDDDRRVGAAHRRDRS